MKRARLEEFRQGAYTHLGKAHDATLLSLPILDFGLEEGLIGSPLTTGSSLHYLLLFFRFFPNLKSKNRIEKCRRLEQ
jgi:hypothetical protein